MNLAQWLKKPGNAQTDLAEAMSRIGPRVTQGAISQWLRKRIPAERVLQLEEATGGDVTRYDSRPDLYGPKPENKAA